MEARLWPNGAVCSHCGETKRVGKRGGKATRIGAHKCYACRKPFTVKLGTLFESSHIPLRLWLQAIYLIAAEAAPCQLPVIVPLAIVLGEGAELPALEFWTRQPWVAA